MPASCLSERILVRLAQAEVCESNPHFCDDLRIARLTVAYAATGEAVYCSPHVLASYVVLGLHPEKVWPAILARRKALGSPDETRAAARKKPPQSVKLWCEKTIAARATNSRGGEAVLCGPRTLPMATASIAALYPSSEAPSSAKTRDYSLAELKRIVGYSGAPGPICALTISALRARGEWPNEKGPATSVLSVAILGMMFEGVCCRSTVQRRIKRAVQLGYWRRLRDANSWTDCPQCSKKRTAAKCECGYKGRSRGPDGKWTGEFMRVPVYEFDVQKFRSAQRCREIRHFDARSYAEYKTAAARGEHPNVTEMPRKPAEGAPPPKSPAPARPEEPVRKTAEHQRVERAEQPKLSKTECAKFIAEMAQAMRESGRTTYAEPRADCEKCRGKGSYPHTGHPGQTIACWCSQRVLPKLTWHEALIQVCQRWRRDQSIVMDALKFWGHSIPQHE